ncbi:hypothetical protein M406DRAFT_267784 [Cryphonectria parasitica EP155]|uniref:CST complex subunit Ten1 n=1 Tax=Cryphonectria parasitica (strain ATCC 38755 / EP155) TaxID=660469 RepID=A0A9P4XTL1_CRYP1|nr:uncharacterized protein M406DRAFT_267784 [Cryphonectria parasitica EP155]KAF3760693.1 hypothetical protein M406DRAFT_267784 [Cryphonectria parasitica EP155]
MSLGPVPSKLTLLSSLPSCGFGDKVRFLGCVASYSIASGTLILQYSYPKCPEVKASVDVRLVLEKLTSEQTSVGQWVNVIGYIASAPPDSSKKHSKRKREVPTVQVQALMLWSAGPLDVGRYETCLGDMATASEPQAKRQKPRSA